MTALFHLRVERAVRGFLFRRFDRDFDACFEQYDGDYVVAAIWRRAGADLDLKAALLSAGANVARMAATADRFDHLSDRDLAAAAGIYRRREVAASRARASALYRDGGAVQMPLPL